MTKSGPSVYRIRRAGGCDPVTVQVFTDLVLAVNFAQTLANWQRLRLEIIRGDGSVAIAVDPEDEPEKS